MVLVTEVIKIQNKLNSMIMVIGWFSVFLSYPFCIRSNRNKKRMPSKMGLVGSDAPMPTLPRDTPGTEAILMESGVRKTTARISLSRVKSAA
jgi:hypothetical protein